LETWGFFGFEWRTFLNFVYCKNLGTQWKLFGTVGWDVGDCEKRGLNKKGPYI
jgi:hypothetical protein